MQADGELPVGAILEHVKVEPTNLSQHLAVLRHKNVELTRKDGNQVLYSLRDPLLIEVLDTMRHYFQRHFIAVLAALLLPTLSKSKDQAQSIAWFENVCG